MEQNLEIAYGKARQFGERQRLVRRRKHITEEGLAKLSGISRSTIRGVEDGRQIPNLLTALAVCEALGTNIGFMTRRDDERIG